MKADAAACPLDQVSVLTLKKCPYLRTYLTCLIQKLWKGQNIPSVWKKAVTILIYKSDDPSDPKNFRPITLENVFLKDYTSFIRNRIFEYLKANDYIECRVQKGFIPKISGTIEHTQQLAYIIRHAKRKQITSVVTLLDLKNAFEEVSHSLIPTVLQFHHIPREMQNIISELYSGFSTSIATKTFVTSPLQVEKGVLQGDCLSPLLFNMLFNTFIQTLTESKEFDQLKYRYDNIIQPRNWFQFADDAAAVTSSEYENQIVLNVFTRWCNWSGMTIRVDKCKTFGIKKMVTRSVQFKPKLFLVREQVPTVDMDKSFKYLGGWYNFEMDNAEQ